MGGYRAERIAEMIHRELAGRLRQENKDPRLTDISITRVEVSRDLRRADIDYMPLGGGTPSAELHDALAEASRSLRGRIGRVLRLRYAPVLVFRPDVHTETAIRVTHLLDKLRQSLGESEEE